MRTMLLSTASASLPDRPSPLAVAALALLRSGRLSGAPLRRCIKAVAVSSVAEPDQHLLVQAGVRPGELNASLSQARATLEQGLAQGIQALTCADAAYPPALRGLAQSPPVLFVRGSLDSLVHGPAVAVVGTRRATAHGQAIARRLGATLAEAGWRVVGGLAGGIDAAAQEGSLHGARAGLMVVDHGLDRLGPKGQRELAERVLAEGGACLSEHAPGVRATPDSLAARHRLEAELACGSVVVEGAASSAAFTHAQHCSALGRVLFAVLPPEDAGVSTQRGLPQRLVQQLQARVIHTRDDYPALLEALAATAQRLGAGQAVAAVAQQRPA